MKVRDLIEKLNNFDQELDVYCHFDGVFSEGDQFSIFHVEDVSINLAERERNDAGQPTIKFNNDDKLAWPTVLLSITNDF